MTTATALIGDSPPSAARVLAAKRLPPPDERRAIRENAGLTKAEMALILDVLAVTLGRWEKGICRPQLRHALAYAQLLNELRQAATEASDG